MKLLCAHSHISDGNMAGKWGDRDEVIANRKRFLDKVGIPYEKCVRANLQLGSEWRQVGKAEVNTYVECDSLITNEVGVGLWMVTADCFPVTIFEPDKGLLALVHLGYQGTNGRLAEKTVRAMQGLGGSPEKMEVWIGPGVHKESYMWPAEAVLQKTDPLWQPYLSTNGQELVEIDIQGYVVDQLKDSGVAADMIHGSEVNTVTSQDYFSHYRSVRTGEPEARFATVAVLREE